MVTNVTAKISVLVFLAIIFIVSSGSNSIAVESSIIETDVDTSYLPYYFEYIDGNNRGKNSKTIYRPIHVCEPLYNNSGNGYYIRASNPSLNYARPATFSMIDINELLKVIDDDPINLIVNDWCFYQDSGAHSCTIAGGGIRNDSAFVFKMKPADEESPELLFLQSENDQNGNGIWDASLMVLLIDDYDLDGKQEAFIYVNPNDDKYTRTLYCVELNNLNIEWNLPIAMVLDHGRLYSIRDSLNPRVIVHGYNSKNGVRDNNFSDEYSSVAIIDKYGKIIFSRIAAIEHFGCNLISSEKNDIFFLPHEGTLRTHLDSAEADNHEYYLSKITGQGDILKTINLSVKPNKLWMMPYHKPNNKVLFLQDYAFNIMMFDSELEKIAETKAPRIMTYLGEIKLPASNQMALFFRDGIYDLDLIKLLHLSLGCAQYYEPLVYDENDCVTDIVLGGYNCYNIGKIKKKSLTKLLNIFFINHKDYFLIVFSGLFVAFILVNYYRRKTRGNLVLIKEQKAELEVIHQALKEAQVKLIEQEKYKQAKDIAGGFAHEIRNALYPVDIVLTRLKLSEKISSINESKLRDYMKDIGSSIGKAIDLTELISQYTKLDSEYMPEKVDLVYLIKEVLKGNRLIIEKSGIAIEFNENSNISVLSNHKQLLVVLNNLLLNCIDALVDKNNPQIIIEIMPNTDYCELKFIDNGVGIESDKLKRIFDTFYSTKPDKGKGIGLSLSKKIIEMYGGEIDVKSNLNQGTTFILRLKRNNNEGKDINS